ncbi:MAG: tetratricopeptide repeat protein [Anaerolineae bacterium]|nr:MAG: tetratricopeptide repeat protein [Anaerolineae bacterium]
MADLTGRMFGKYRLTERLGRGGMAEVYRAYQPNLERDVAVKVMHGYLAEDEGFVGRFKREARAVAALRHPHIVQVYDFDVKDDAYYMVMEYISGETLKQRLKRLNAQGKRMPLEEVTRVFRALCNALDYAHVQGCIHRDIKPANVMFDGGRLVLTDFGISSIVGGTRYTASGAMVGTPAYMSPEQGQGESGDVRSDVYSLGVILYEMVTGQVPYDADTPLAIVLKHLNEPLPLPRQVRTDVPPAVERVILKALAKSPEDRYQSAGALADALEVAVERAEMPAEVLPEPLEPVMGVAVPAPGPKRMPWVLVAVASLIVVGLVAAALIVLPRLGGEREAAPSATPATAVAAEATSHVVTSTPQPTSLVVEASPSTPLSEAMAHYEAGAAAFEEWDLEEAIEELSRAIEADPGFAQAYYLRGAIYREKGEEAEAEADLSQAITLEPGLVEAYYERGDLYLDQARGEDAQRDLTAAIELQPDYAEAYHKRALACDWYVHGCDDSLVLADLGRAIELAPDSAEFWLVRGEFYFWEEKYDLALPDLIQAVELAPDDDYAWEYLGHVYYLLGQAEEAIASYDQALGLDPTDLNLYYHRGATYLGIGDQDAALEDFERVLLLEPAHSGAHYGRGRVHFAAGRFQEAIADFTEVMKDEDEDYSWLHFEEDSPYLDRALAYHALGRTEEALGDLDALIEAYPDEHLPYYQRGLIYKELGQVDAAIADFKMVWENAPDEEWRSKATEELKALQGG